MSVQLVAPLPQFEGEVTAVIQKTDGTTDTLSVPVPPMVKGRGGELVPPTMLVACNPLIVGAGVDFRILWPKFQQSMATGPQKSAGRRLGLGI